MPNTMVYLGGGGKCATLKKSQRPENASKFVRLFLDWIFYHGYLSQMVLIISGKCFLEYIFIAGEVRWVYKVGLLRCG
jgi:hypothetical protein